MAVDTKTKVFSHNLLTHNVLIVWQPKYDLGIPIVDEHHRGIVSTINSLYFSIQNNHAEKVLQPIINMVNSYTRIHFEIEEGFYEICGYPDLARHKEWHNELSNALTSVGKKSSWDQDPKEFLEFLKKWWIDHICEKDRHFKEYLIELEKATN